MEKYKSYCEISLTNVFYYIVNDKLHDVPAMQKTVTEVMESKLPFNEYCEKGTQIQCCIYAILSETLPMAGVQKHTLTERYIFFSNSFL